MPFDRSFFCALLGSSLALCPTAHGAAFYNLGAVTGSLSHNGKYFVATMSTGAVYRWTAATGLQPVGINLGAFFTAHAISDDGLVIAGDRVVAGTQTAFRWTSAGGFTNLGDLPGGSTYSQSTAMSADGSVIVGGSPSAASGTNGEAFRWTAATGMVPLGDLTGGAYNSIALACSADGSVVVGNGTQAAGTEGFRWTFAGGIVGLGALNPNSFNSQAYDVSADGQVVVGYSTDGLLREQATRWTAPGTFTPLGFASGNPNEWSQAHAVNAVGDLIIGNNNTGDAKGLLWDPTHGTRYLLNALQSDFGVPVPAGWKVDGGWDLSDDGSVIAGTGYSPAGIYSTWIAVVPEPGVATATAVLFACTVHRARRTPP
ncbi:MAG: hypothetical protein QM770_19345 [Tepidisphaeraceae bacterium]